MWPKVTGRVCLDIVLSVFMLADNIIWPSHSLRKKWSFPLRISSLSVTKSAVSCGSKLKLWRSTNQSKLWRSTNGVWSNISWVMRIFQTGLYSFMFLLKIYIFCVEANLFGYICSYHQLMELFSSLYSNKQT